jgi:hypothetical protein
MVSLPTELRDALAAAGEGPVRLTDPETRTEYVLLPAERYDRLVTDFDDDPLTDADRLHLIRHAGERAGWDDPEMHVYDQLDPRKTT